MTNEEANGTSATAVIDQPPVAQQNIKDELLSCQWNGCGEKTQTPELLYDHICERHVGRKSTNNLNLTCEWGNCRTVTVKRDHITSHIRVHVPLKPHKCDFCGKSFKRPQDLKKHVKTHADDSVLLRSPEPTNNPRHPDSGYRVENSKQNGYYDNPAQPAQQIHHQQGYVPHQNSHPGGFFGGHQQPYGSVFYAASNGAEMAPHAAYESKRRGYEALNDFFGDAKRRQLDPTSYHDVGPRLLALQGIEVPLHMSLPEAQSVPAMTHVDGPGAGVTQHQYALPPMPNLRTKNDLVNIDQFLEQIQSTVYESSNRVAAAGTAQPGAHYVNGGMHMRQSNSPPTLQSTGVSMAAHATVPPVNASLMPATSSATRNGTPALTPPSSTLSYASAHSPASVGSAHGISPLPRSTGAMYPSLPAVSSHGELGYPTSVSTAPASTLASVFDDDHRQRYSGGMLQQASQPRIKNESDVSPDSTSAKSSRQGSSGGEGLGEKVKGLDLSSATSAAIDPALKSPSADGSERETSVEKAHEEWVGNIQVIESLRRFIAQRLQQHRYEADADEMEGIQHESAAPKVATGNTATEHGQGSLYPVLKAEAA
ncbi:MAG: hypothetical protein M1825_006373 [Sarcosagium campestre]|nr:MAG: hypothetical protein M1825_006373 [Sarcosagium campestre]